MAMSSTIELFVLSLLCTILAIVVSFERQTVTNLRQFSADGWGGRFQVNRNLLEDLIKELKYQDDVCGEEINLRLPTSWPHSPYDPARFGEIYIYYANIREPMIEDIGDQSIHGIKNHLESYPILTVVLSVVASNDTSPTQLLLSSITDSPKLVLEPYSTNYEISEYIDLIEEEENGTVILRKGKDTMVLQFQNDVSCSKNDEVLLEENFPGSTNSRSRLFVSSFPNAFDWGCESFAANFTFCKKLQERKCDIVRFGNDVCSVYSTEIVSRCPSSMQIREITGFFRDTIPFLPYETSEHFTSIESESIHVVHDVGVVFPCFS